MAFPAATAEKKTLRVSDEKVNTHQQSELFILRMTNRFGSRNGGWEKAISHRFNIVRRLINKILSAEKSLRINKG